VQGLPSIVRVPLSEPLFILGALFIAVVFFIPGGLASLPNRLRKAGLDPVRAALVQEWGRPLMLRFRRDGGDTSEMALADADVKDYDALVLPGGSASPRNRDVGRGAVGGGRT